MTNRTYEILDRLSVLLAGIALGFAISVLIELL